MQPVIPAEMVGSAVQLVIFFLTIVGAFLGLVMVGRP